MEEELYANAGEYLDEYTDQLNAWKPAIQTGNYIADVILNEADRSCKDKGISLKVSGIIHEAIKLNDTDVVTILGNAVDNAIEACERIQEGKKWIQVKFGLYNEYLNIIIRNSTNGNITWDTQKEDKKRHGFGMDNMKKCVERNEGSIKITEDKGVVTLNILVKSFEEII